MAFANEDASTSREAALHRPQVVAPFEEQRDSPLGALIGNFAKLRGHPAVGDRVELHARQGVVAVGIEPRRDQNELRSVGLEHRRNNPIERCSIIADACAGRERDVEVVAASFPLPDLVRGSGAWVEGPLVKRNVEDLGGLVKNISSVPFP